jgi:hypothetical protein
VLNKHSIFQNANLNLSVFRTDNHGAVDCFATSQEFRLGNYCATATCVATIAAPLLLSF